MNKKIIIIVLIILLALSMFGVNFWISKQVNIAKEVALSQGYQKGWDAAKNRLKEQIGPIALENSENDKIVGVIKKYNSYQLEVKVNTTLLLSDPSLDNRIITINDQTKISAFKIKSSEQFKREVEKYYQDNEIDPKTFVPSPDEAWGPERYEQTEAKKEDLKVGQTIDIYADGDFLNSKSLVARQIVIKN